MPVVRAQAEMQMPARKAECCFGSVHAVGESEDDKASGEEHLEEEEEHRGGDGIGLRAAAGARVMRNPAMEKKDEEVPGRAWVALAAAAVGDVAEEEIAGLPACGWKPEEMAERCWLRWRTRVR